MVKRSLMLSLSFVCGVFVVNANEPVVEAFHADGLKQISSEFLDSLALAYYSDNKQELVNSCETAKNFYVNIYDLLKCLSFEQVLNMKKVLEPMIHSFIDSATEEQKAALGKIWAFFEMLFDKRATLKLTAEQKLQIKDCIEKVMNIVKGNSEAVTFVENINKLKLS